MPRLRIVPVAVSLTVSLLALSASASSGLFLNLPPVKGESVAENRKGWIDLSSLQWGVGTSINWSGGTGAVQVSRPSVSDMVWTQAMDSTFPQLMQKLTDPKGVTAQFDIVRSAAQRTGPYLSLTTTGSRVDGVNFANASVSGSLAYDAITMTWDPSGLGQPGTKTSTTYDQLKNSVSGASSRAPTIPVSKSGPSAATGGDVSIYLRLGSGLSAIAGDATAVGYQNWLELDSAQFGAGRSVVGGGGSQQTSLPSFSELTISGQASAALPAMFGALAKGAHLADATLEFVRGGSFGPVTFMQMYMQDVYLTGLSLSTGGAESVSYSESLAFGKFSQTVWALDGDGSRGAASRFGYDIVKAMAVPAAMAPTAIGFGAGNLSALPGTAESQSGPPGSATPVPEPGQWALMLAGLGLMAGLARRRIQR